METNSAPTPDEAREYLQAAREAEQTTRYPALPWPLLIFDIIAYPLWVLSYVYAESFFVPVGFGLALLNFAVLYRSGISPAKDQTGWWPAIAAGIVIVTLVAAIIIYEGTDSAIAIWAAAPVPSIIFLVYSIAYSRSRSAQANGQK